MWPETVGTACHIVLTGAVTGDHFAAVSADLVAKDYAVSVQRRPWGASEPTETSLVRELSMPGLDAPPAVPLAGSPNGVPLAHVVLLEGGLFDARSVLGDAAFASALADTVGSIDAAFSRYDGVVVMVSPADVAAGRCAMADAWGGSSHQWIVEAGNVAALLAAVDAILGSGVELEHKYLLRPPLPGVLDGAAALGHGRWLTLTQTYLPAEAGSERRVRRTIYGNVDGQGAGGNASSRATYVETVKSSEAGLARSEIETAITAQRYAELVAEAGPPAPRIEKQRWVGVGGLCRVEVDHISYPYDLWLAEVEVLDASDAVLLPSFLDVVREVTGDPAYKNRALADGIGL